jgi:hypothetical protein
LPVRGDKHKNPSIKRGVCPHPKRDPSTPLCRDIMAAIIKTALETVKDICRKKGCLKINFLKLNSGILVCYSMRI